MAGAEFYLKDEQGKIIMWNLVTNDEGIIFIEKLPIGKYQFIEKKAPSGYILDATSLSFAVSEDQNKLISLRKENVPKVSPPKETPPISKKRLPKTNSLTKGYGSLIGLVLVFIVVYAWYEPKRK